MKGGRDKKVPLWIAMVVVQGSVILVSRLEAWNGAYWTLSQGRYLDQSTLVADIGVDDVDGYCCGAGRFEW